ncbi:hypothetical protein [Agromyces arachidis]|uniref:hypothetical protein n=1 Tax=Agromyces arachidis TaxID=766966 RepID=UPI00405687B1
MFCMLRGRRAAKATPEILEIRVHGVRNTPPAEMLETTPERIIRDRGDDLGSFWLGHPTPPPSRGVTRTEAFSWGAQARTGGGALAAIGRAVVHAGWFLLLPYALVNLAYWTRRIDQQPSAHAHQWAGGTGAATVRVFGLLLTLVAAAAFSSVAVDLIAVQCFRDGQVCASLPDALDGLRDLERDQRATLFGILPIATMLVLYVIGRRGRVSFEERVKEFGSDVQGDAPEPGVPLLATGGFWAQARVGPTSEWLHLAASIALVLFILAFDAAYLADDTGCWRGGESKIDAQCLISGLDRPLPAAFAIGSLSLLAGVVVLVALASHDRSVRRTNRKRGFAMAALSIAIAGYAAWTVLTFADGGARVDDGRGMLGLKATPIVIVVLALFLALAGIGWKRPRDWRRAASGVFLLGGAISLILSHWDGEHRWMLTAAAGGFVLLHLAVALSTPVDLRFQAWRGHGAAVAMILALFASMALSSLLVLGAAFWLGTPAESGEVVGIWRTPGSAANALDIPDAWERFAVLLTAIVLLMILLVLAALIRNVIRFVGFTLPTLRLPDRDEVDNAKLAGVDRPNPATYAPRLDGLAGGIRRRVGIRRGSHLMHRGEPLFGWLAGFCAIGFLSLSSGIIFDTVRDALDDAAPGLPSAIRVGSNGVLVLVAVAAVGAVVTHAAASTERPLGVFWDVVAFFPRAGHPFAPPCFGERVVPELAARIRDWFLKGDGGTPRRVILTAHSMGSTICAATILALRGEKLGHGPDAGDEMTEHLALLSYGTQLRAYFSRFFPSVFGPEILGVPGLLGPSLWLRDPWQRQVLAEFARPTLPAPRHDRLRTLTGLLGAEGTTVPRWRSLWRRTDYLGFPVYAYRGDGNPIDLGATESAPASYLWRIATHSDYLGTPQFRQARDDLVEGLGGHARPEAPAVSAARSARPRSPAGSTRRTTTRR